MNPDTRRAEILRHARALFLEKGYAATEMEDIRNRCAISRGGLYHHFGAKSAILSAIVELEVRAWADDLAQNEGDPIVELLRSASEHLGADAGIRMALTETDDLGLYLSQLDACMTAILLPLLTQRLADAVIPGHRPEHVAELFLTVNAHINRRTILGTWTNSEAAGFAATALHTLLPLLKAGSDVAQLAEDLKDAYPK